MTIGERLIMYRAKHKLSQNKLGELLGERLDTIYRAEHGVKMHKANELRLQMEMDELEAKDGHIQM